MPLIKVYFDEVEAPRDLMFALVGNVRGTTEMNNENEYVSCAFPAGELPIVMREVKKYLIKK